MYVCINILFITLNEPGPIFIYSIFKEARRQLHKNAASNIEQLLAATPHMAPALRPPASHHENYQS